MLTPLTTFEDDKLYYAGEVSDDAEECKGIFDEPDDAKSEEAMSQGSNFEMQKELQAENKR